MFIQRRSGRDPRFRYVQLQVDTPPVNNSTVKVATPFTWTVKKDTNYGGIIYLFYTSSGVADYSMGFTTPTLDPNPFDRGYSVGWGTGNDTVNPFTSGATLQNSGNTRGAVVRFRIKPASDGQFTMTFSQAVAEVSDTTLDFGSFGYLMNLEGEQP